jgi:hypothetical protein
MLGDISEGKAYWCHLSEPCIKYVPQWSLRLVPSEFEQEFFKRNNHKTRMEQEDGKDIGLSVLINRKVKNMDDVLKKPLLFDKDKKPLELYEELPNGSNVKVKYKLWERTHPFTGDVHKGIDLIAVMLLDETPSIF